MHPRRIEIEVEVEIDVEVELLRDREDARDLLVGMDVAVDEAGDDETAVEPLLGPVGGERRRDRGKAAGGDADIDRLRLLAGDARPAQDEVEGHCAASASIRSNP